MAQIAHCSAQFITDKRLHFDPSEILFFQIEKYTVNFIITLFTFMLNNENHQIISSKCYLIMNDKQIKRTMARRLFIIVNGRLNYYIIN